MTQEAVAYFGLGCFWHPDDSFSKLPGVLRTRAGYAGGDKESPSYEEVCQGKTGHTETVEVTYDPKKIAYRDLLRHFFTEHDPTIAQKEQYQSVIFYRTDEERREAEEEKASEEKKRGQNVVTEIRPAVPFWEAEEYHQKYYQKHGVSGVC